ncbi:MAG: Gfo/Idh/MocA family oxidoreductase [Candidatus Bathyarchaeia archaeon]
MDKVRIGIIGTGGISRFHMRGYQRNTDIIEVVTVCDINKETATKRAEEWGIKKVYTDYNKLVKDDEIDAVDICTPHNMHAPPAIAAAEAGKHILVEKPMAVEIKDCEEMNRAAKKAGVKLMMEHNYCFFPPIAKLKELIMDGVLGEPLACVCKLREGGNWNTKTTYFNWIGGWRSQPEISGGGLLMDYAYHHLYTARYLMGEFEKVTAMVDKRTDLPSKPYMIDDVNMVVWKYKDEKKYGMLEADLFNPIYRDQRFEVTGTKAVGLVTGKMEQCVRIGGTKLLSALIVYNLEGTQFYMDGGPSRPSYEDWRATMLQGAFSPAEDVTSTETARRMTRHFAECILQDEKPLQDGNDGKRMLEICKAIYKSAETEKAITLS